MSLDRGDIQKVKDFWEFIRLYHLFTENAFKSAPPPKSNKSKQAPEALTAEHLLLHQKAHCDIILYSVVF